jgi:hypothetical protein
MALRLKFDALQAKQQHFDQPAEMKKKEIILTIIKMKINYIRLFRIHPDWAPHVIL